MDLRPHHIWALHRASIHESAHAIAAMHYGIAPKQLTIRPNGSGECRLSLTGISPTERRIICDMGYYAELHFLGAADPWQSQSDYAASTLDVISEFDRRRVCEMLLWDEAIAGEINALATELRRQGIMFERDLRIFTNAEASPLARYAPLYPDYQQSPVVTCLPSRAASPSVVVEERHMRELDAVLVAVVESFTKSTCKRALCPAF